VAFRGWYTYGYDNGREGFNPNTTAIAPATIASLHLAWQVNYHDFNTWTQPILADNVPGHRAVLFVGGSSGNEQAFDALSGAQLWKTSLGQTQFSCGGGPAYLGIGGSAAYDPGSQTLYVAANSNASLNGTANPAIVRLAASNGSVVGRIGVEPSPLPGELDLTHTSVALANGRAYVGTGSTCDLSSWRGRVAQADAGLTTTSSFYTVWNQGGAYSGGGVWGEGGVALDASGNVYTGVGNADTNSGTVGPQAPFAQTTNETVGYGEHVVKLGGDLSGPLANQRPNFGSPIDWDLTGSPALFHPLGCGTLAALQGKAGFLVAYDTANLNAGPFAAMQLSPSTYDAPYLGNPGYSPITGLLYASVETGMASVTTPGLVAFSITCGSPPSLSLVWTAAFGPDSFSASLPRSAVTVTAGGVAFVGTPCNSNGAGGCTSTATSPAGGALWAIDATNGTVLHGGKPLLITADIIRMAPIVDGNWVYVVDNSANLYGFTTDPGVPAIAIRRGIANVRSNFSVLRRR
jgi:hypothetical protein